MQMQNAKCKVQSGVWREAPSDVLRSTLCIPHSSRRAGISLMEVLISIFIMAVGMVSIASLLPVGGIQVQKANVEEQKAMLGLNAQREFQIRGIVVNYQDTSGIHEVILLA